MEGIETIREGDYTATLYQDEDPGSPREWDQLGVMVHWHRHYELGDRRVDDTEEEALSRGGFPLLRRYLRRFKGATVILPLGLLDHSGLHMWAGGGPHSSDAAGWDSGTVGFIYDSPKGRETTGVPLDKIDEQLRAEVEEYDQFLSGAVYGYVIKHAPATEDDLFDDEDDGEEVNSCWGFFGYEYAVEEMKDALKNLVAHRAAEAVKIDRMWAA